MALLPEDVIQIVPKAAYIGWVNIIQKASIGLAYEPIQDSHPPPQLFSSHNEHYERRLVSKGEKIIRIFVVDAGKFDDPICGCFRYIDLADASNGEPDYVALSYCWAATPGGNAQITIKAEGHRDHHHESHHGHRHAKRRGRRRHDSGEKPFAVSRTVEAALRRFRDKKNPLKIWIDAISINQKDKAEKASQVPLMRLIYQKAATVHIWLGEEDDGLGLALQVIRDIYNANNDQEKCPGGQECLCDGIKHSALAEKLTELTVSRVRPAVHEVFDLTWESLFPSGENPTLYGLMRSLFEHPWFQRVWVIQEALMAQRPLIHHGREYITWLELVKVNSWLRPFASQEKHFRGQFTLPAVWGTLGSVLEGSQSPPSILEVFLEALDMKASEARDRLFATLAFGKEIIDSSGKIPSHLQPNYKKSQEQIMARFTRWCIMDRRSLAVLSYLHCQPGRAWRRVLCNDDPFKGTDLPRPTWTIGAEGQFKWSQATVAYGFPAFQAAGESYPNEELLDVDLSSRDSLLLRLQGCRVGRVKALGYPTESIVFAYPGRKFNTEKDGDNEDGHGESLDYDDADVEISSVFDYILDPCGYHDIWTDREDRRAEDITSSDQWRDRYATHVDSHQICGRSQDLTAEESTANGVESPPDYIPACIDKCFFEDSKGRRGLCPWAARVHDVIAILEGGRIPYLLRPVPRDTVHMEDSDEENPTDGENATEDDDNESTEGNDSGGERGGHHDDGFFELIGECYVEGLMDGGYFAKRGSRLEVFTLV